MTLLIVEDENIIRKGFIITIKKLEFDFELILEAGDGEEGLRLFAEHSPDIVITDIRMPLMDGLTFIQRAREISTRSKFIILSGYSDFEYARTALQYEVRDYLLKPSSMMEIQKVLSRVMNEIKKTEKENTALEACLNNYASRLDQFSQLLLGDILLGKYPEKEIENLLLHHAISLPENGFFVFCFQIFSESSEDNSDVDHKQHYDYIHSLLSRSFSLYPTNMLTPHHCFIVSPRKNHTDILSEIQKAVENIKAHQKLSGIKVYMAFSSMHQSVQKLPALYNKTLEQLFCRFFSPDSILFSASSQSALSGITIPGAMLESFYHCFTGNSRFELRQSFLNLMHYISASSNMNPRGFIQAVDQISHYLTVSLIRENHIPDHPVKLDLDVRQGFLTCCNLDELYAYLLSLLMQYRNTILGINDASPIACVRSPIDQAISYIDQNYYKELDLTLIARLVSMNSSYFSSQFKKKTGLSFSTYLRNTRLEKAKSLLLHSNQKLHEISGAIGIENVKYFCKLFKNYTGLTPTEYKKQFQKSS